MNTNQQVESSAVQPEGGLCDPSDERRVEPTSLPEQEGASPTEGPGLPAELIQLISQEIDRRFQSAKDKRWAELEKKYGSLHELSQQADSPLPQPEVSEGEPELTAQLVERAENLLKRLGLRDQPEVNALLHKGDLMHGPGGYFELVDRVLDIVLGEDNLPTPSPAGVISPGGGNPANQDLLEIYHQRKKQVRPGDVNALTALKREFREKGLDIF